MVGLVKVLNKSIHVMYLTLCAQQTHLAVFLVFSVFFTYRFFPKVFLESHASMSFLFWSLWIECFYYQNSTSQNTTHSSSSHQVRRVFQTRESNRCSLNIHSVPGMVQWCHRPRGWRGQLLWSSHFGGLFLSCTHPSLWNYYLLNRLHFVLCYLVICITGLGSIRWRGVVLNDYCILLA